MTQSSNTQTNSLPFLFFQTFSANYLRFIFSEFVSLRKSCVEFPWIGQNNNV